MRVTAQGKLFVLGVSPFRFHGVRYGLAHQSAGDAASFRLDLDTMASEGATVVSMPSAPMWAIEPATTSGLRFLLELDDVDLNLIAAASRRERRRLVRELATRVRLAVRLWKGTHALLGVSLGRRATARLSRPEPEIAARAANEIAIAVHDEDAGLLTACRGCWPLHSECPAELDFLLMDCALSSWADLPTALMSCHWDIGDRPLVLGETSLTGVAAPKTQDIPGIIDTALRCGVGGTILREFSRTEASKPQLLGAGITRRSVRDLDVEWPSISVVINAYNAEATLDECLCHCDRLEYPKLEVIVVDDGSTDATPAIAGAHPRSDLVTIPHSGLSVGRNVGYRSAHGELVVYLDADAYPSPDWPWYLALAALGDRVGGSGGPNVPPPDEPSSARTVAQSPGGPVPQLRGPDRAEHLPGCNMAFWRDVLEQLHGFDPVLEAAEDIEFEWRVVESGRELAYHPAALVWHHRRPGLRHYLRQQRHYGRGQAILERRDPSRFPPGHRVRNAAMRLRPPRNDSARVSFYPVRYLSLPRHDGPSLELAHQWGMPVAIVVCFTSPLALVRRKLGAPAGVATGFMGALFAIDLLLAGEDRRRAERTLGFRARVATFRLLRPLAFRWGHLRGRHEPLRSSTAKPPVPAPARAEAEVRAAET